MTDNRIAFTTAGSLAEARKLAEAMVERRLAACVNIVPRIQSIYRWKGKVGESREFLLIIKTTATAFKAVAAAIKELHSYELPECVCVTIEDGSREYLDWINQSVGRAETTRKKQ